MFRRINILLAAALIAVLTMMFTGARAQAQAFDMTQRLNLRGLVERIAHQHGVPSHIALALVKRESGFRVNAVGKAGEIGLGQIKLSTARSMGYRGSRQGLFDPTTNLTYSMKYAARAIRCGSIRQYQSGVRCRS